MVRPFFLLFSLFSASAFSAPLDQDILSCEAHRLSSPNECLTNEVATVELSKACASPVSYVCGKDPKGLVPNSKCKVITFDKSEMAKIPEVSEGMKQVQQKVKDFLDAHHRECFLRRGNACDEYLRDRHAKEITKLQVDTVYTDDRMARIQKTFGDIKNALLEMIQNSTKVSEEQRTFLKKRIENTTLYDPRGKDYVPSCYLMGDGVPDNTIANVEMDPPYVEFCMGAMMMFDREDEAELMTVMGHELTHSIDPCNLDRLARNTNSPQFSGDKVYGSTLKCLRGGQGDRGCENGQLHCNAGDAVQNICRQYPLAASVPATPPGGEAPLTRERCVERLGLIQNCPLSGGVAEQSDGSSLGNYRNAPDPVDQMQESFADFLGSQATAKVLKQRSETMSVQDKLDHLTAVGAGYASLHGTCLTGNTNDPHPAGFIRVNNNLLGNTDFGKLFCPGTERKECDGL